MKNDDSGGGLFRAVSTHLLWSCLLASVSCTPAAFGTTIADWEEKTAVHEIQVAEGKPLAIGRALYYKNAVYQGESANGEPYGYGRMEFTNGETYEGEFYLGSYKGRGTYLWPSGQSYDGEWLNGTYHGEGRLTYEDGFHYEGGWEAGRRSGHGSQEWSCCVYTGEWLNGMRHGHGDFSYRHGSSWVGQWIEDEFTGQGEMRAIEGPDYRGSFLNGKRSGQGLATYPNGDTYYGSWLNDQMNGFGVFQWARGPRYEGDFKDGEKDGWGLYFNESGEAWCQKWRAGVYQSTIEESRRKEGGGCQPASSADLQQPNPVEKIMSEQRLEEKPLNEGIIPPAAWIVVLILVALAVDYLWLGAGRKGPDSSSGITHQTNPDGSGGFGSKASAAGSSSNTLVGHSTEEGPARMDDSVTNAQSGKKRFSLMSMREFCILISIIPPCALLGALAVALNKGYEFGLKDVVAAATDSLWWAFLLWPFAIGFLLGQRGKS